MSVVSILNWSEIVKFFSTGRRRSVGICLILMLLTLAVYLPVKNFDFINYDDYDYITQNPHIQSGVTKQELVWAFSRISGDATYWHPVTWISHMIDRQFFGLDAGAHHLINVLIHIVDVVLLFLVFQKLTGTFWRSA